MKKTILATLAIASMMSCSNDEVLDTPAKQAITFDNAFVEKAPGTRAAYDGSYTTGTLKEFQVYGTITNASGATGRVFTGDVVSYNGTAWTYTCPTQYWVPGNTYDFWAIADGNVDGATSVFTDKFVPKAINLLDASQQKDVLLATRTYRNYQTTYGTVVEFTFHHLMAKAKFTVKNAITTNSGYSYKVSDIAVKTEKEAVYNIADGEWAIAETPATYSLSFGHAVDVAIPEGAEAADIAFDEKVESNFDRLLIPNSKHITVTFKCELFKDGILIQTQERSVTTTKVVSLEQGKAYNFIISLGNPGDPITFNVDKIEDWDTDHNDDGTNNDETPIN